MFICSAGVIRTDFMVPFFIFEFEWVNIKNIWVNYCFRWYNICWIHIAGITGHGEWLLFTSDSHFLSHRLTYLLSFDYFSVLIRLGRAAGWKYGWMDRLEERQGRVFWLEALDVNQYVGREHIAVLCSAVRRWESWITHFTELDFVCSYATQVLHKLDCRGIRLPEL